MSDALTDGRRFRVLAVVDDFSRENLVLVADTSLSGQRVARELEGTWGSGQLFQEITEIEDVRNLRQQQERRDKYDPAIPPPSFDNNQLRIVIF